jgi:predicted phosphodiesterase
MSQLSIQIIGDLHLENCRDFPQIIPTAKYLFLAGDIGHLNNQVWRDFIRYLAELEPGWQQIFYVLGNHEYYSNSKTMKVLREGYREYLAQFPRIKLLDKEVAYLPDDGCVVVGATMWSQSEFSLVSQINDFRRINLKSDPTNPASRTINITPPAMNELHRLEKEWLFGELESHGKKEDISTIIILTHFPLTRDGTSSPSYSGQKQAIKNYYANDFHQELVLKKNTKNIISISGHTHYEYDFVRDGIRYINAGACGYHLPPN